MMFEQHVTLNGTKVRQMLQVGEIPSRDFSRPEVAQVLVNAMRQSAVSQVEAWYRCE
jgi:sulfate adenylyltransferase